MKKIKISGIDLAFLIAFVVITLLGAGAWWYFSGNLTTAQDAVAAAKSDYDKVSSNPKYKVVVSAGNAKVLQANIDLLKSQIDPVIQTRFLSKDNTLHSITNVDPVAWKHDLDDLVHRLNTSAKTHSVALPANFYYGFSRYLTGSPGDEQTAVLKKQLVGIGQLSGVLIGAPVKGIQAIRRTYEEDAGNGGATGDDRLPGRSVSAPANAYTAYPFEIEFQCTSETLRTVIQGLMDSPYVFVIRSMTIQNSVPNSPQVSALDQMAGPPATTPSVIGGDPGEVAAATPPKGPQYLFGNSVLKVKMRVDMIEWNVGLVGSTSTTGSGKGTGSKGRKQTPHLNPAPHD